tara:strand:- start:15665 stop:16540 length:876 start_codon:yes stop_codon:yes gene_type:complete
MKQIKPLLALAILTIMLFSCTKDTENINDEGNLVAQLGNSIKTQTPNKAFDTQANGIYHGIIASGENQSRGKIWINLGNNGNYNAYVEMVEEGAHKFKLVPSNNEEANQTEFLFKGVTGQFTLNVSDIQSPVVTNAYLFDLPYFSTVVKSTSQLRAASYTGTFQENGGGAFSGTWNLISTGAPAPEGWGYETITSAIVTFNDHMLTDNTFELFNYPCAGTPNCTPQMGSQPGNENAIISHSQTSNFAAPTTWDLSTGGGNYFNNTCGIVTSGTFTWTGSVTKTGTISIDID